MADLVDRAILQDDEYLKALKRIDTNIDKMSKRGQKAFGDVDKGAQLSGAKIGAISGIVSSLVTEFINLGRQAVDILVGIGQQSVQTALEFDTIRARLLGIFDGSEEAAGAAFDFIRDRSKQLGIDLGELAGAFLPKTESLAQFERVAKIATALARSDPEQGAIGARIALIEALSGTFTSLQRRFEIPKADIDRIKEAFDAQGIEGFLATLETVLAESGKSFDDLADTAATSFGQVQQIGVEKLGQLGEPIVAALQRAAENIGAFLEANDTEITLFVTSIGDAIASVIDFISQVDFSQFDIDALVATGQQIFRIVEALKLFITQAGQFIQAIRPAIESVTILDELIGFLGDAFSRLDEALVTGSQILLLAQAGFAGLQAAIAPIVGIFGSLFDAIELALTGDFANAGLALEESFARAQGELIDLDGATGDFNDTIVGGLAAFNEYDKAVSDQVNNQDELRARLEDTSTAGDDLADSLLKQRQDAANAADALGEYEAALAKVGEQQSKFETELEQRGSDLRLDAERKRLDNIEDFADKREDIARKNLDAIEDIERNFARDLEDADRDRERALVDQAKEEAKARLDVERKFQQQFRDIRQRFAFDLEDAARRRDAVAFVQLQRQQQQEIQSAQQTRNDDLQQVQQQGQTKREEIRTGLQREEEDNRLSLERKLEDQRISNERDIEQQSIAEQRKLEEFNTWQQRQFEDLALWAERKQAELQTSLADELAIIQEYEAAKTAVVKQNLEERLAVIQDFNSALAAAQQPGFGDIGAAFSGIPSFQRGGVVPGPSGVPQIIQAHGGEVVLNPQMINTIPNTSTMNITNDNRRSANMGLLDPNSIDGILATKVENMLVRMLGSA